MAMTAEALTERADLTEAGRRLAEGVRSLEAATDWLLANRETAELYLEDSQQGGALLRLLKSLAVPAAMEWPQGEPIALMTALAMAGQHWQTGARALALGALWSWLENQTGAATKLIPLGQTDAQRLLDRMLRPADLGQLGCALRRIGLHGLSERHRHSTR